MDDAAAETSTIAEWLSAGLGMLSEVLGSLGNPLTPANASAADQVQNGIVVVVCVLLIVMTCASWWRSRKKFFRATSWMRSMLVASDWSMPMSASDGGNSATKQEMRVASDLHRDSSPSDNSRLANGSDLDKVEWKFWSSVEDIVSSARDGEEDKKNENARAKKRTKALLKSAFNLSMTERSGAIGQQYLPILLSYGTLISPAMDFRQGAGRPQQIYSIGLFFTFLLIIGGLLTAPNHDNMVSIIISKALISVVAIACAGSLTVVVGRWDTVFDRQCVELRKAFAERNNIRISGEKFDVAIVNSDEPIAIRPEMHDDVSPETKRLMSQQTIVDIARLNRVLATLKDAQDQLENESVGLGTISGTAENMHKELQGIQENFGRLLSKTERIAESLSAISGAEKDSA